MWQTLRRALPFLGFSCCSLVLIRHRVSTPRPSVNNNCSASRLLLCLRFATLCLDSTQLLGYTPLASFSVPQLVPWLPMDYFCCSNFCLRRRADEYQYQYH